MTHTVGWIRVAVLCCGVCGAAYAQGPAWYWDTAGDLEGWTPAPWNDNFAVAAAGGAMVYTYPDLGYGFTSPSAYLGTNYDGDTFRYARLAVEMTGAPTSDPVTCLLWWVCDVNAGNNGGGAHAFSIDPTAGAQTVLVDMQASGQYFDAYTGNILQLRIEAPWALDPAAGNAAAWTGTATHFYSLELVDHVDFLDTDGDGLDDFWGTANFGDLTTADETTDYDDDGVLDIDEYEGDTDPKMPNYSEVSHFGTLAPGHDLWQTDARYAVRDALWIRPEQNVLWGFGNMYNPKVIQVDDAQCPFRMWFFGWAAADCNPGFSGCDAIFFARGQDLDTWEVYAGPGTWDATMNAGLWAPVISAQDTFYDEWHNGDPAVVYRKGTYYMAYSATGFDLDGYLYGQGGDTDGEISCVMGATSPDGINWTRTSEPLLLFPPDVGPQSPWLSADYGMFHRPSLLFEEGRWRLYFDYWNPVGGLSMGYAETDDAAFGPGAFVIRYAGERPLLYNWPNPNVVKVGAQYHSYADPPGYGEGWPGRQCAEAISDDGINWTILGYTQPDSDTEANQIPEGAVVETDGQSWLLMFYACQIGGDPYDFRYDRIRYLKRLIGGDVVWCDFAHAGEELGTVALPYNAVADAVTAVHPGGRIEFMGDSVLPDSEETPRLTAPMTLSASGGAVRIGVAGAGAPLRASGAAPVTWTPVVEPADYGLPEAPERFPGPEVMPLSGEVLW